jgi:hypothetical protein
MSLLNVTCILFFSLFSLDYKVDKIVEVKICT